MARVPFKVSGVIPVDEFNNVEWFHIYDLLEGMTLVNSRISLQLGNIFSIPPSGALGLYAPWLNTTGCVTVQWQTGVTDPGPPDVNPVTGPYGDFVLRDCFNFRTDSIFQLPPGTAPTEYAVSVRSNTDTTYVSKGMRLVPPGVSGYIYIGLQSYIGGLDFGMLVGGVINYDFLILNPSGVG